MTNQKTILITGAGSGIGLQTVRLFVRNRWKVIAVDINEAAIDKLATELGDLIVPVKGDGLLQMGTHPSIDTYLIDRMIDVNIKGVLYCIDAALPMLKNTPGAHIVNMSSTSAEYGTPDHAVYSASKFFVRGLTEALNIEFEPLGIQVSAIVAPYVNTPMVNDAIFKARTVQKLGVKIEPEQVAKTVWDAVHGNKVIWRVGLDATILNILMRLLGSSARGIVKKLTGY